MIELYLPPKPAIIRPIEQNLLRPGYLPLSREMRRAVCKELIARGTISKDQAVQAMFLVPPPFMASVPPARTFIGRQTADTGTGPYSFGSIVIPRPGLCVAVVTSTSDTVTNATGTIAMSGITFGGNAGTVVIERGGAASGNLRAYSAIAQYNMAAGATIAIAPTLAGGGGPLNCQLDVYLLEYLQSTTAVSSGDAQTGAGTTTGTTLNILANGVAIGGVAAGLNYTFTWTGLTEDSDAGFDFGSSGAASSQLMSAETGRTIQATLSTTTIRSMVCAAWA